MRWHGIEVTSHFMEAMDRRPEVANHPESVLEALDRPLKVEEQPNGRTRRWVYVEGARKYLRVVVEPDGSTVQTAFFDRRFSPD